MIGIKFSGALLLAMTWTYVSGYTNFAQLTDDLHGIFKSDEKAAEWSKHFKMWRLAEENATRNGSRFGAIPLNCSEVQLKSEAVPESVHALRPGDIKVIAAMGDSLTAGNAAGAQNLLEVLLQYRGISWDIGGDGDLQFMVTLPNILRQFNSDIVGASQKISPVWFKQLSQLNVAVQGAVAADLPEQADELVRRLQQRGDINYEQDWKLVTIFIGTNDLCSYCNNKFQSRASIYRRNIKKAIDILQKNLPRTLVSVVNILHVEMLQKTHAVSQFCVFAHQIECPCLAPERTRQRQGRRQRRPSPSRNLTEFSDLVIAYQREIAELVESGDYDSQDDFTVVLQRFLENTELPTVRGSNNADLAFFAPDCFHWSQLAHSQIAKGLWNNMLEPVGNKSSAFDAEAPNALQCPNTICPFIRTSKNSANCSIYAANNTTIQSTISTVPAESTEFASKATSATVPLNESTMPDETTETTEQTSETPPIPRTTNSNSTNKNVSDSGSVDLRFLGLVEAGEKKIVVDDLAAKKIKQKNTKKFTERTPLLDAEMTQIY